MLASFCELPAGKFDLVLGVPVSFDNTLAVVQNSTIVLLVVISMNRNRLCNKLVVLEKIDTIGEAKLVIDASKPENGINLSKRKAKY